MRQVRRVAHRLILSARFHLEKWKLVPGHYPVRIIRREIEEDGVVFECHNLSEANRVVFFDDEDEFLKLLVDRLEPADVFFDVGACIGVYSLHAARHCRQVVAFEPEPELRRHLESNVTINCEGNVTVMPYALGEKSGMICLFTDGAEGKSPSLRALGHTGSLEIEARSVDALVAAGAVPAPTVMKIDVEGAEMLVLKGMETLLSQRPPRALYVELHSSMLQGFGSSQEEVLSVLRAAGYTIQWRARRGTQLHAVFVR